METPETPSRPADFTSQERIDKALEATRNDSAMEVRKKLGASMLEALGNRRNARMQEAILATAERIISQKQSLYERIVTLEEQAIACEAFLQAVSDGDFDITERGEVILRGKIFNQRDYGL